MLIPQEGPGGPSRHNGGTRPGGGVGGGGGAGCGGSGGGGEANLNSRRRDLDFGFGEMVISQEGPGGPSRHNGGTRPGGDREANLNSCLLYTSPSPRDATLSRMPSSA